MTHNYVQPSAIYVRERLRDVIGRESATNHVVGDWREI